MDMDMEVRKQVLIAAVRDFLKNTPTVPGEPSKAGDAVFAALLEDWDRLSRPAQGKLVLAVAILAKHHGAEGRADREAQQIIRRMKDEP